MAADFKNSVTKDNLMRAFAGESQARNRYIFAAQQAKKAKLQVIESVFTYTANQEMAHAKVFYNHLKELAGETIHVDGGYPVTFQRISESFCVWHSTTSMRNMTMSTKLSGKRPKRKALCRWQIPFL